jgi:hypothetical protein
VLVIFSLAFFYTHFHLSFYSLLLSFLFGLFILFAAGVHIFAVTAHVLLRFHILILTSLALFFRPFYPLCGWRVHLRSDCTRAARGVATQGRTDLVDVHGSSQRGDLLTIIDTIGVDIHGSTERGDLLTIIDTIGVDVHGSTKRGDLLTITNTIGVNVHGSTQRGNLPASTYTIDCL